MWCPSRSNVSELVMFWSSSTLSGVNCLAVVVVLIPNCSNLSFYAAFDLASQCICLVALKE